MFKASSLRKFSSLLLRHEWLSRLLRLEPAVKWHSYLYMGMLQGSNRGLERPLLFDFGMPV